MSFSETAKEFQSMMSQDYKIGLNKQFQLKEDLNKYTRDNYDSIERKMGRFMQKTPRAANIKPRPAVKPAPKAKLSKMVTIKKVDEHGNVILVNEEQLVSAMDDSSDFSFEDDEDRVWYQEANSRACLKNLDWAATPLFKHF